MRFALAMKAEQVRDAARGLTEFADDERTLAIVRAIEETIVEHVARAQAAQSGKSVVIIIDHEPGQWRVWKDALMLAGAFRRLALSISAAIEHDR